MVELGPPDLRAELRPQPRAIGGAMMSNPGRNEEHERFRKIDAAFRAGDLAALRSAVEDPAGLPNGPMPMSIGSCLGYGMGNRTWR